MSKHAMLAISVVISCCAATLLSTAPARAQAPENVLLVVNDSNPDSVRIGEYYAKKRAVARDDVVHLKLEAKDEISRADFNSLVQAPIVKALAQRNAWDRILYIVLTKGVPLRVAGTSGRGGTVASVDSELSLLYRQATGATTPLVGQVSNPYFLGDAPVGQAKAFTHADHDIFLVTRLDGFTVQDVLGLIDRGSAPVAAGRFLLDEKASWQDKGNEWLQGAAERLKAGGFGDRVTLETSSRVLADETDVIGYYSWGSNDPAITRRHFGLKFLPGALAATFVSTDARTFTEPPATWKIGSWNDRNSFYAGSPQSLAGDLVREGATGTAGHVAEPYLDGTVRPDILFPAYAAGFDLAEAFYLATPYLSWQTVIVGDPLCTPFPRKQALARGDIDRGVDKETGLPALFSRRAMRVAAETMSDTALATLKVKAESAVRRDDRAGAREAYEQLTARDPKNVEAQIALASLYETAGEYDKAIERYRAALAVQPANAIALNNLAYSLAVRRNQARDALPLAERAYAASGGNPSVMDTLGWIYHLTGDDAKAAPLLAQAARLLPSNGEVRLHLAVVYGAGGMVAQAISELAKAIELDPALEKHAEAVALRARLKGK